MFSSQYLLLFLKSSRSCVLLHFNLSEYGPGLTVGLQVAELHAFLQGLLSEWLQRLILVVAQVGGCVVLFHHVALCVNLQQDSTCVVQLMRW